MEPQPFTPTAPRPPGNPNWFQGMPAEPAGEPYRWKPGQSGNPRGPKIDPIAEMARTAAPAIMQRLINIAMGKIDIPVEAERQVAQLVAGTQYENKKASKKKGKAADSQPPTDESAVVWKTPLVADQIRAAAFVIERGYGKATEILPDGTSIFAFLVPPVRQSTEEWEAAHSGPELNQ